MRTALALLAVVALAGCQQEVQEVHPTQMEDDGEMPMFQPQLGPNPVFREATAAAPGHELIVTDLLLGPEEVGGAHYHPWEEYLYILGGSAYLQIEGEETRELGPGDAVVIPRERVHIPAAGMDGVRAIVVRVHDEGDPERVSAEPVTGL